jgi:hypothetical protein
MEVWWAGADGSVQDAYYYDGQGWNQFTLASAGNSFTWTQGTPGYYGGGTMLQYPNGNIMMVGDLIYSGGGTSFYLGESNIWNMMVPSSTGSYVSMSEPIAYQMNSSRLYYATNMLPSGNVFLLGGEDSSAGSETNTGEMFYGPGWGTITSFPQSTFGDDPSMLLNDGLILLGTGAEQGYPYTSTALTYLYNPTTKAITTMVNGTSRSIAPGTYSAGIPKVRNETNAEEGWVKLPNGEVLSYDLWVSNYYGPKSGGFAELFNPTKGEWQEISPGDGTAKGSIPALSAPTDVNGKEWDEMGPAVFLPNGNAFFIGGGTSNTALYDPATNTWSSGPQIPYPYTADDAPAAVLPDGDVIFAADAALKSGRYSGPTALFDYSPAAGTITQLTGSNAPSDRGLSAYGSYVFRMLILPTGQLMVTDAGDGETWVGTPNGAPNAAWRPSITSITGSGSVYTLTGLRVNGMDAGAAYGDDAEMDENYPIIRLTSTYGTVYYATTSNWSNLGVATGGASETVTFTLPGGIPAGTYSLTEIGVGISSLPVPFTVPARARMGAVGSPVPAGPTLLGPDGAIATLDPPKSVTTGRAIGWQALPPPPDAFGNGGLAAWPVGGTSDGLVAATGSTLVAFTDAVDALLAGEELAGTGTAASRVAHRISAGIPTGPMA